MALSFITGFMAGSLGVLLVLFVLSSIVAKQRKRRMQRLRKHFIKSSLNEGWN